MKPQTKSRRSWPSILIATVFILLAGWLWLSRQWLVDAAAYFQYTPSGAVAGLVEQATFTDGAKFTFYATSPQVENKAAFNASCPRQDPKSPILGCYANGAIFIYNVTDQRLDGIKTVTAAHELLHAEYDRLSSTKKNRINALLQADYDRLKTDDLERRMKYYDKNEPGQSLNELHSILGSEFDNLDPALEQYYDGFFTNRSKVVALNKKVEAIFSGLQQTGQQLADRINNLASSINNEVASYNRDIKALNSDIQTFNSRADDGFLSQTDFSLARNQLLGRGDQLASRKSTIQSKVKQFEALKLELDATNAESTAINRSLDSVISDVPEVN